MNKKLYVNVFMTEIGPYGHVVTPKQYTHLKQMMSWGMWTYRGVEVRVTSGPDISADKVEVCYQAVTDVWIDGGEPNISQIRAAVKELVQHRQMR